MSILICMTAAYVLFAIYLQFSGKNGLEEKRDKNIFLCLGVLSVILKIAVAYMSEGYKTDMNCFRSWSSYGAAVAPWDFYDSIWCDYPPGYLYVLSFVGMVKKIFPGAEDVIIKMPSIICDLICGVLIFNVARKNGEEGTGRRMSLLYLFNVAAFVNGAMWGQVDSVFTLLLTLSLLFLGEEKYIKSALLLGISISVKIQTLMFLPVYIFFVAEKFLKTRDKELIRKFLQSAAVTFVTVLLIAMPYIIKKGVPYLFELYFSTSSQYPYASLNAFNFFSMLGKNLTQSGDTFFLFSYKVWGMINIFVSVMLCGVMYMKGRGAGKLFYVSAMLIFLIYTFSSDMHERYLFPAMALFFVAGVLDKNNVIKLIAVLISVLQAVNVGYLYFINLDNVHHIPPDNPLLTWGSTVSVALCIFAFLYGMRHYCRKEKTKRW